MSRKNLRDVAKLMNTQPGYFKPLRTLTLAGVLGGIGLSLASAATIDINPIKDNTLYEYVPADGDRSNALGNHFFAGETAVGEIRRGVLAFDIAGNIPAGSTITGVSLSLNMSRTPSDTARTVELHVLLADWGEGTSIAPGEEGDGAPATPNDASERKPVGWRRRGVRLEFGTDGCGCAVVAGQSGQQFRLAGVGGRVGHRDGEAVRHSREHQPACAEYRIHFSSDADTYTNSNSYTNPNA